MVIKIIWNKVRLYKRFEVDIWGFNLLDSNITKKKICLFEKLYLNTNQLFIASDINNSEENEKRYIYRVDINEMDMLLKKQKWKFLSKRVSRLFFLTLSYKQFNKLLSKASKMEGFRESNYIMLIENRLFAMLYRTHFISNIFDIRSFIFNRNVLINNNIVTYYNMEIKYGDILCIISNVVKTIKFNIIKRFTLNNIYFNVPEYLFISYKLMFAFVYKEPQLKDIIYPNQLIDIYRAADI